MTTNNQNPYKVDVLAFGAHPDDVEACAGGFLAKAASQNLKTAIVDLTQGEMGTNGTIEERAKEAEKGRKILKSLYRENLKMPDSNIELSRENLMKVVETIRKYQPETVLTPWLIDRHPDHENCGDLVTKACFYSGLGKIVTNYEKWRPKNIFYFMLHYEFEPSFILDISNVFNVKMEALKAHESQFMPKAKGAVKSYINRPEFLQFWETRSLYYGYKIGAKHGEPYKVREGFLGINDIKSLTSNSV